MSDQTSSAAGRFPSDQQWVSQRALSRLERVFDWNTHQQNQNAAIAAKRTIDDNTASQEIRRELIAALYRPDPNNAENLSNRITALGEQTSEIKEQLHKLTERLDEVADTTTKTCELVVIQTADAEERIRAIEARLPDGQNPQSAAAAASSHPPGRTARISVARAKQLPDNREILEQIYAAPARFVLQYPQINEKHPDQPLQNPARALRAAAKLKLRQLCES